MEEVISKAVFMDLLVNFERKLAREKLLEDQLSAAVILIGKQEDTVVNLQLKSTN